MSDEQFIQRLTAADPVDPATLPMAGSPQAEQLLDSVLANPSTVAAGPPVSATPAGGQGAFSAPPGPKPAPPGPLMQPPAGPGHLIEIDQPAVAARPNSRGWLSGSRAALIATAAAVVLLVASVAVLAPRNTPSALAEVQSAAEAAASAETGRIEVTFAVSHTGSEIDERASGEIDVVFAGDDYAISMSLGEVTGMSGSEFDEIMPVIDDIRIVDDVFYIEEMEGQWIGIESGGMFGQMVGDEIDPRTTVDPIQDLSEAEEVGTVEIDGVETTHYRSVVDLGDESLSQSGWSGFEEIDVEVEGEMTIDIYVDGDGVLRGFDVTGDIRDPNGVEGAGTVELSTRLLDLGADLTVEVPEGAEIFDPFAELMEGLEDLEGLEDFDLEGFDLEEFDLDG